MSLTVWISTAHCIVANLSDFSKSHYLLSAYLSIKHAVIMHSVITHSSITRLSAATNVKYRDRPHYDAAHVAAHGAYWGRDVD
jgi:hypothetical protein